MADRREGSLEIIADWDTSANSAMAAALSAGGGARLKEPPARVAQKVFPRGRAPKDEIAKGAITRKLAVRLQWMWRQGRDCSQFEKLRSRADGSEIPMERSIDTRLIKEPNIFLFVLGLGQQAVHVQFPLGRDVHFSVGNCWYYKLYRDAALVACRILAGIVQLSR